MTDDRDICERLEDQSIDGAIYLRINAAKEIRYLRHYVARLEDELLEEEYQHGRTIVTLEEAREHIRKQALDIVTLGQEVGRLREALKDQRYGGIDEGFRCAITTLSWISVDREKNGTAEEFHLVEKCIKAVVDAQVHIREEARAALAETEKTNG